MKLFSIAMAASLFVAPTLFANGPELTIEKVRGAGNGCKSDENGKPLDWNVTVDNVSKTLQIDFSSFVAEPKQKKVRCNLRIYVSVPQGHTFYTYSSTVYGSADLAPNEYGNMFTSLEFLGKVFSMDQAYVIPKGYQGSWKTEPEIYKGKTTAPCSGETQKLGYNMLLKLFGNDSEIQVSAKQGSFTNIKFDVKKCK